MSSRNTIYAFFTRNKSADYKIELSRRALDPTELQDYIDSFHAVATPNSKIEQSFAKLFHKGPSKTYDVKTKSFSSTQTSLFNESTEVFSIERDIALIATKTRPIESVPQTASHIKLFKSYSFSLMNHSDWMLQIDLVKELSNPLEFGTKLKSAKQLLVDTDLEKMDQSAYDYVTTTLIKLNKEPMTKSELLELINEVLPATIEEDHGVSSKYQNMIYSLAKDIFKDPVRISQFKRQSGFKKLCSNTIEMSRPIFFKQVLSDIDSFYMTDKMDGMRAMLVIDEFYRKSGTRRIHLGDSIKAVSDKVYEISTFQESSKSKTIEVDHTVLDVEMMIEKNGKKTFHCFDVIALKSKRLDNVPFKVRFSKFEEVKTLLEKHELGSVKTFHKLEKETYEKQIKDFYQEKRTYHIDGLIFTPQGQFHRDAVSAKKTKYDRIFNTGYYNTISFKWKPLDQLTIDFYIMANPKKKDSYVLCSGVDKRTFDKLRLSVFEGYQPPQSPNSHQYFPIQFESYDGKFNCEWTPTKEENEVYASSIDLQENDTDKKSFNYNGLVGEFRFAEHNKLLSKPKLIKLRTDRVHDIAKGEYYGNNIKYAELIYHSIQHPLTIELMTSNKREGYFAESDDWYSAQRHYNSFVKTHLMETYLYPKSDKSRIMDIACGHGQDLARSIDMGFDEVVLLDKDVDALYDLLDRKYNLRIKRKEASATVHVRQLDLEESVDNNIKLLKLGKESADHQMINFALHYICHSGGPQKRHPLEEFSLFCNYYLKSGGCLMITTFIGADVFKVLQDKDEWFLEENGRVKYSIKKSYSSTTLADDDQAIEVLLPFSAGTYYKEYLVNYQHVQSVFEKQNFKLIASDSFASLMRSYKKQNPRGYAELTKADQEYVSLYGFMIFQKQ